MHVQSAVWCITVKCDSLNKKQYWWIPIIPQYICQVLAKSVFKGPRYKAFKSDTSAKIFPYEFIHGQVYPAALIQVLCYKMA